MDRDKFDKVLLGWVVMAVVVITILIITLATLNGDNQSRDTARNTAPVNKETVKMITPPTKTIEIKSADFGSFSEPISIVINGSWGSGLGQFGLLKPPPGAGEAEGPRGFAVDDAGSIYILDQINSRVQIFSPKGKLVRQISIKTKMVEDISATSLGDIVLLDGQVNKKFYIYDSKIKAFVPCSTMFDAVMLLLMGYSPLNVP